MTEVQRRRFSRLPFQCSAWLQIAADEYPCEVIDLSLRGALLKIELSSAPLLGTPCLLELELGENVTVRMEAEIAHLGAQGIGIACRETDLDSLIHLRRLLTLNLGDADLVDRELSALLDHSDTHSGTEPAPDS